MDAVQETRQTAKQEAGMTGIPRIESVRDPAVNKALFTLYGNLIEPLDKIERTREKIAQAEETAADTQGEEKFSVSEFLSHAVSLFPKMFAIVFIIMFILSQFVEALDMDILPALRLIAVIAAAASIVFTYVQDAGSLAARNKMRREAYESALHALAELESDLEWQIDQIRDVICFVPPSYRFSDALRYFVESYVNSRVDDLKEAVNAYDTYYFRSQTVQMQQQILEQERKNADALSRIEYAQLCMMEQLDGIRSDIWLSGGFYDVF